MRGTLTVVGESSGDTGRAGLRATAGDPEGAHRTTSHPDAPADVRVIPHGPRPRCGPTRQLPRPDDQASDRPDDPGDLRARPAAPGGLDDRAPARRPPESADDGQPTTHLIRRAADAPTPTRSRGGEPSRRPSTSTTTTGWTRPPGTTGVGCRGCSWSPTPRRGAWISRTGGYDVPLSSPSAASPRTTSSPTRSRREVHARL